MIKVIVHSSEVKTRSGTSTRTGRPYSIREQEGFVMLPGRPYPERLSLTLGDEENAYQPGTYSLHADSFFVGRFGDLQCRARLDRASRQAPQQPKAVAG